MKVDLNRLKFDKGLSQAELGDVLGIAQAQVSLMINGKRDIQQEHIDRLVTKFGKEFVDAYVIPDEVVDVFTTPQARTIEAKIYPAGVVEEIREEVRAEIVEEIKEEMAIPIISSEVASAPNTNIKKYIRDKSDELKRIYINDLAEGAKVAECVESTSMWPMFQPGDWVFVKFIDKDSIIDGKTYYFDLNTLPTMIRKVKIENDKLRLIAKNPNYGDIIIGQNEVNNIARIVGMWRSSFGDQYDEIEAVRRKKDEQVHTLIEQNGQALQIIKDLIKK